MTEWKADGRWVMEGGTGLHCKIIARCEGGAEEAKANAILIAGLGSENNRLRELFRKILGWMKEAGYTEKFWPDRQEVIREAEAALHQ